MLFRNRYSNMKRSAILLQSLTRMLITRTDYSRSRLAAILIQSMYRMHRDRTSYNKTRCNVIMIQSLARRRAARRVFDSMVTANLDHQMITIIDLWTKTSEIFRSRAMYSRTFFESDLARSMLASKTRKDKIEELTKLSPTEIKHRTKALSKEKTNIEDGMRGWSKLDGIYEQFGIPVSSKVRF